MDEATMTGADMKQREKIVKSMKKNFKDFRKRYGERAKEVMYATATKMAMKEDLQGSSVAKVPYKEMDMENLVQDAIKEIPEDDGPHTSTIGDMDAANFQTVAKPEDVVNQANNEGNRESTAVIATRKTGKPFKAIRSKGPKSYGPEDLSGAVASVAIGEGFDDYKSIAHDLVKKHGKNITKKHIDDYAKDRDSRSGLDHEEVMSHVRNMNEAVKDAADKGEYDYEGDMAKSSLRTIVRNAQMMHDMLGEDTNLPEWVASKVTLAEDYIVAAAQYMQSEMNEEVEQIDELSNKTLKSYAKKAASSIVKTNSTGNIDKKRATGIIRASEKLGVSHQPVVRATLAAGQENLHKSRGDVELAASSAKTKKANLSAFKKSVNKVKEEVELDEISKELAWKAADKASEKTRVAAYHSIYGGESGHKMFQKAVRQHKKISDYASAKTPKVPYVKEENEDPYSETTPHTLGGWRGSSRNPAHQETPKKKYKKTRSQERFDSRFKEMDANYPHRSDN